MMDGELTAGDDLTVLLAAQQYQEADDGDVSPDAADDSAEDFMDIAALQESFGADLETDVSVDALAALLADTLPDGGDDAADAAPSESAQEEALMGLLQATGIEEEPMTPESLAQWASELGLDADDLGADDAAETPAGPDELPDALAGLDLSGLDALDTLDGLDDAQADPA